MGMHLRNKFPSLLWLLLLLLLEVDFRIYFKFYMNGKIYSTQGQTMAEMDYACDHVSLQTSLCNTVIDNPTHRDNDTIIDGILEFLHTDTIWWVPISLRHAVCGKTGLSLYTAFISLIHSPCMRAQNVCKYWCFMVSSPPPPL